MLTRLLIGAALFAALSHAGAVSAQTAPSTQPPAETAPPKPNDYADPKSWLCRPGQTGSACDIDHTTTVVAADGTLTKETWKADPNAPIDCFYVYPTVSTDPTPNSDMTADPAETNVIKQQFARLASQCRPYAPLYRQVTLAGLRRVLAGGGGGASLDQRPAVRRCARRVQLLPAERQQGARLRARRPLAGIVHPRGADPQGNRGQAGPAADGVGDPARNGRSRCRQGKTSAARSSTCRSAARRRRPDA